MKFWGKRIAIKKVIRCVNAHKTRTWRVVPNELPNGNGMQTRVDPLGINCGNLRFLWLSVRDHVILTNFIQSRDARINALLGLWNFVCLFIFSLFLAPRFDAWTVLGALPTVLLLWHANEGSIEILLGSRRSSHKSLADLSAAHPVVKHRNSWTVFSNWSGRFNLY